MSQDKLILFNFDSNKHKNGGAWSVVSKHFSNLLCFFYNISFTTIHRNIISIFLIVHQTAVGKMFLYQSIRWKSERWNQDAQCKINKKNKTEDVEKEKSNLLFSHKTRTINFNSSFFLCRFFRYFDEIKKEKYDSFMWDVLSLFAVSLLF